MAVVIRLRRMGTRNRPFYRVVAADSRSPNNGRIIENIGWYDPVSKKTKVNLQQDRIDYWTGQGAQLSTTVKNLVKKVRNGDIRAAAPAAVAPPAEPEIPTTEETPTEVAEVAADAPAEEKVAESDS